VFAYFDETGMHGSAPDTVVAGYLFSKDGAKRFREMFQENVFPLLPPNQRGERIFHACKCCPPLGNDEYSYLGAGERQHIIDLMVDAIVKTATMGSVIGIEKKEYQKAVSRSPVLRQLSGSEYSVCLQRSLDSVSTWMHEKGLRGRLQYVFEAGCEHQKEANEILFNVSKSEAMRTKYRWHNYAFVEKGANVPQLFASDLLAWEWQRRRLNDLHPQRGEKRMTLNKLAKEVPHIMGYESELSLGVRALINTNHGVTNVEGPYRITNSYFQALTVPTKKES
jgi:hypothetical protein